MRHRPQAYLANRYEIPHQDGSCKIAMVTIQITLNNQPMLVLQSEDHPFAIERAIKGTGWDINSWDGDLLTLTTDFRVKRVNTSANAKLYRYEVSGANPLMQNQKMVAIELFTNRGEPLLTIQSEDNPLAIEHSLRRDGWNITAWNGDEMKVSFIITRDASSNNPRQYQPQPTVIVQNSPDGCSTGCLIIILFIVIAGAIGAMGQSL